MKPSHLQTKATALLQLDTRRKAHHAALSSLHADPHGIAPLYSAERGLKMWRRLREIEAGMTKANADYGSGADCLSARDSATTNATAAVSRIFGGTLPPGFYVETDWREPALKLLAKYTPEAFPTDRAGNGILCGKVSL